MTTDSSTPPVLQVIIGSTRPGRAGLPVGRWVAERAERHGGFTVETVDLAEVALPLLDEPNHPRLRAYTKQHTLDFSATVSRADAFVLVLPEYNHGYTAPVKNALDYLSEEWANKPMGLVSYGGVAGGVRAVQALKPVLNLLRLVPLNESVLIPFVNKYLEGEGDERRFVPDEHIESGTNAMLDALAVWVPTCRAAAAAAATRR